MTPDAFRKLTVPLLAAACVALVPGTMPISVQAQPAKAAAPRFPVVTLQAGMHIIQAEVADDQPRRMQGLMHRRELPGNQGMLFVFDRADAHCMWMKNTYIPLTVAFMDDEGRILNLADMEPQSETNHCARGAARYALEMKQGWFAQRGLREGQAIGGVAGVRPR